MKAAKTLFVLVFALVCLFYGTNAWAQGGVGELTGIVFDPLGASVAGAKVRLTSAATGAVREQETTGAGAYRFVALPVGGTYTLKVEATGFRTAVIADIVITVGTVVTRDVHLELGSITQTVTVEAGVQLVQPTDSALSHVVDLSIWQNQPLELRNQNVFIELAAGAVPGQVAMQGTGDRGAAVNGARSGTGNYLVEGTDNYESGQAGRGQIDDGVGGGPGGASTSISPEAISEYRIITNGFAAEYGKGGGFITDTVLKTGTNSLHGSLFEYNRVQALAAQHFFTTAGHRDSEVRNQFGGSVGGPVLKDKTFFFYSMEYQRLRIAAPLHAIGTTQQFLDFVKSGGLQKWAESDPNGVCMQNLAHACPGAFAQSATLGPIFTKLAQLGPFPLATSGFSNIGGGFYTDKLRYPVPVFGDVFVADPTHLNEYRISAKVDHKLSSKDQLSGFFLNETANSGSPFDGGANDIGPPVVSDGRGENVGVTWTHTFSPTVLNTFKVSYLRHRLDFGAPAGYLGIPSINTFYDPLTVGFGMFAGIPQFFTENTFQFQDQLSFIRGKHSFKTGWLYSRARNGSSFFNDTFGSFNPNGIEDLVTDLAFTDNADLAVLGKFVNGSSPVNSAAVNAATGQLPEVYRGFRANEFAAYFQDDWRLTSRLTINWGVRWEYFGPPHNFRPNIDSNFYFGTPVTPVKTTSTNPFFPLNDPFYAGVATGTFQVRNHEIWNKDTNNFAPRLGFAYDVLGNQKLVLRAGAGIMYDRIYNNVFENIRFNPPFFSDNQIGFLSNKVPVGALSNPGLYTVPFTSTGAFASGKAAVPNPRHMDQNMVTPYFEQYHLGIQWEFHRGYMLETDYVGTMGHKLVSIVDSNTFNGRVAKGFPTTRINPNVGADNFRTNNMASNYHGLQATVRKSYASGLSFLANYTWSKALDEYSDVFFNRATGGTIHPTDNMNPKADYGPADFNVKHRFVGAFSYELPFFRKNRWVGGWAANSIVSLLSGIPFSPYSSSSRYDLNKDGYNTDRIVYVGPGGPMNSTTGGSPADGYFNTTNWKRAVCPASVNGGLWCDAPIGRNSMTGPGLKNVDFNITKKFRVTERVSVALLGSFFNVFNHPNFQLPSRNDTSSSYGRSTKTYDPRITQLALRLDF